VANLTRNQIYSETWPLGSDVTITVDDPSNGTGVDYTDSGIVGGTGGNDPNYTWIEFNLFDLILKPNDVVVMSGNSITKELTIAPLEITNVNTNLDLVHGKTGAGLRVAVFARGVNGWGRRDAVADQYGNWLVDFSTVGPEPDHEIIDITSSSDIDVDLFDADGDYTEVTRFIYSPNIGASVKDNSVWGDQWANGSTVTLTIDDPSNGHGVDFQQEQVSGPADWDPNQTHVNFDLGNFQLKLDDLVTMTNGTITKSLLVPHLQVTGVNVDTDVVFGVADPQVEVITYVEGPSGWVTRRTVSTLEGEWSMDFSIPGAEEDEQDIVNVTYGMNISAQRADEDSDFTEYAFVPDWIASPAIPLVFSVSSSVNISVPRANTENISVLNALDDSLFRLDNEGNVVPLAATGYTVSQDGKVYTVTLRADATWSNGDPVTAQQFVDDILRVLDPEVGSDFGYILYPIHNAEGFNTGTITNRNLVGIKALNNLTLEFTLEQPTSHFPKILAAPVMLPARQDLINQYGVSWTSPSHFLSNGLYKLAEYDAGHIVLEKNLVYNGPALAAYSQIAFDVIPDPAAQVASYKAGDVDVLLSAALSTVTADPSLKKDLSVMPSPGVQYINFFTSISPINNPLVRKALATAVDRQALLDNILMTSWRAPATGVIPPELAGYQGTGVGYSYNPAQAQLFLSQAGYDHGAGFPALNFFAVSQNQATVLQAIANQWNNVLGITVHIDMISVTERGTILSNCRQNPTTCPYAGYLTGWLIDYPDAYNILNDLFSPDSPYNHLEWDNATYRNLLALAVSESNSVQRIIDLQQAEKILVQDDAAVLPLYYLDSVLVVRPGIYPYYSPMYFSNLAYWSDVDPAGDGMTAEVIGSSGGTITTEDNVVSVDVPAAALQEEVTLSVTDLGGDYQVTTSQEEMDVLSSFSIQPHGLHFSVPVTLTFSWNDTDNDGLVDVTLQPEENIMLIKDGEPITPLPCKDNPNCDRVANTLSVDVTSFSLFELVSPVDQSPVDKTPPVVSSITRASTSPTSSPSVTFNVVFSEAVTGVDIVAPFSVFTLTTGLTGTSITAINGSGTNYTVMVNTGSGNGTLRLDVIDDNTIVDTAGNQLGGNANGDGNFVSGEIYTILKTPTFGDVSLGYWAWNYIERLYAAGITGGCASNPLMYCPGSVVTRDQMAVFLLKGKHGANYVPPSATGMFADVPQNYWAAAWIEQLAREGITSGCSVSSAQYCPGSAVTRDQMAVFLLKAKHGSGYVPPTATGMFQDVPTNYWAADWIEQLAAEGITGGCSITPKLYCPGTPVTRDQMAVFLVKNFNLP
jgi:oligopeptide transport system substrate-binding protein